MFGRFRPNAGRFNAPPARISGGSATHDPSLSVLSRSGADPSLSVLSRSGAHDPSLSVLQRSGHDPAQSTLSKL